MIPPAYRSWFQSQKLRRQTKCVSPRAGPYLNPESVNLNIYSSKKEIWFASFKDSGPWDTAASEQTSSHCAWTWEKHDTGFWKMNKSGIPITYWKWNEAVSHFQISKWILHADGYKRRNHEFFPRIFARASASRYARYEPVAKVALNRYRNDSQEEYVDYLVRLPYITKRLTQFKQLKFKKLKNSNER